MVASGDRQEHTAEVKLVTMCPQLLHALEEVVTQCNKVLGFVLIVRTLAGLRRQTNANVFLCRRRAAETSKGFSLVAFALFSENLLERSRLRGGPRARTWDGVTDNVAVLPAFPWEAM